jgi:ubiquitin-conjugating enzyme E2 J2
MANIIQQKRFTNELKMLSNEPLHYVTSYPDDKDPLTWYFLIRGQKETSFHGGDYIGKIIHSKKYPAEPPAYFMLTPSGRYEVNKEICLTNSRYHKGEWSSTWNIKTILIAFYSIFLDDSTTGISHIHKSDAERKVLAKGAIEYNKKFHNDYSRNKIALINSSSPKISFSSLISY